MHASNDFFDNAGGYAGIAGEQTIIERVGLVRRGLPIEVVQSVLDNGLMTAAELDQIVIPRKTLANRRKLGTLTPEQSDRFLRVTRLLSIAKQTFGDEKKAGTWLRRATDVFAGQRPLDLLDTDEGTRAVETLLGRISHGIAA